MKTGLNPEELLKLYSHPYDLGISLTYDDGHWGYSISHRNDVFELACVDPIWRDSADAREAVVDLLRDAIREVESMSDPPKLEEKLNLELVREISARLFTHHDISTEEMRPTPT